MLRETRTPHIFLPVREDDLYDPPRHLRAYGLGWNLEDYRGKLLVYHGGGLPGMTSRVMMVPEAELGIVVLTNSESAAAGLLSLHIVDLFLSEALGTDYLGEFMARRAAREAEQAEEVAGEGQPDTAEVARPAGLVGNYRSPILGAARVTQEGDALVFEAHEHGGLRCRFAAQAQQVEASAPLVVPCTWDDPNMGVSEIRVERKGKRVRSLHFRVRPEFYDPLEYGFTRR